MLKSLQNTLKVGEVLVPYHIDTAKSNNPSYKKSSLFSTKYLTNSPIMV